MIRSNIEAAIEAKQKELDKNRDDILKLDKVLESIKAQQRKLLEKDTDLYYELEELKEQLWLILNVRNVFIFLFVSLRM